MKKVITSLVLSVASLVFTLVVVELGIRLFTSSRQISWNDRPKEYYISERSETFQDYPHSEVKPSNTYRVAVIGDSFTFAPYMQFDDAFPKRIERYLNLNNVPKKVEVINYGVPAYSTNHEVPVVKRALKEGADLILMQITFNDPELKPYTPTQLLRDKNKFGELELKGWIFDHWRTLSFVLTRIHNTETHKNYVKKFFDLFERPKTWRNFSKSWEEIAKSASDSNVPLVAVVFPLYGVPLNDQYPFAPIHQKVKTLLDSLQVRSLDLYDDFKGIPLDRLQVIVGQDFHPNEIGHRIAAESILRWFERDKIIPQEFLPVVKSNERIGIRKPGSTKSLVEEEALRESAAASSTSEEES